MECLLKAGSVSRWRDDLEEVQRKGFGGMMKDEGKY
jgi:hypothetical protein